MALQGAVDDELVDLVLGELVVAGVLPQSITSTPGASWSSSPRGARRSTTTTSAVASRRRPRTVMSPSSPGPPPTRCTVPARCATGSGSRGRGARRCPAGQRRRRGSPGPGRGRRRRRRRRGRRRRRVPPRGSRRVRRLRRRPARTRRGLGPPRRDGVVGRAVAGGGVDEPRAVDVAVGVLARVPHDRVVRDQRRDVLADPRRDELDERPGVEQRPGTAGGDRATADHEDASSGEVEDDRVRRCAHGDPSPRDLSRRLSRGGEDPHLDRDPDRRGRRRRSRGPGSCHRCGGRCRAADPATASIRWRPR